MTDNKMNLRDLDLEGKKVLVRCDFNVPLDLLNKSKIADDTRITESLSTIKYLIENGAKVILCSHLGKARERLSLSCVAERLSQLLGLKVMFLKNITGKRSLEKSTHIKNGDVCLLENLRLYEGEELNQSFFAKNLARYADIYVNDAFGSCHRNHSSIVAITSYLPSYAGFLIEKEIKALTDLKSKAKRPFVAISGGGKVSSKIGVLYSLLDKVNTLIIAPGPAYTFVMAMGGNVGNSLVEIDKVPIVKEIMEKAKSKGVKLLFPIDVVVVKEIKAGAESKICNIYDIPEGYKGVDIGPATIELYKKELVQAKTIFWNGTVGISEISDFATGTNSIAEILALCSAYTCVGGGDSVSAIKKLGLEINFKHLSTGGGATLEFIEGKELPGIAAINNCELN